MLWGIICASRPSSALFPLLLTLRSTCSSASGPAEFRDSSKGAGAAGIGVASPSQAAPFDSLTGLATASREQECFSNSENLIFTLETFYF